MVSDAKSKSGKRGCSDAVGNILETEQRLSLSARWKILRDYYEAQGIAAWESVPFFVTSNAFIAESYADLILAFLRDNRGQLQPGSPVYMVELGAGSGCFSFYLLRELERKLKFFKQLNSLELCLVMTDAAEANVRHWADNEKLEPFVASGRLKFACFDPRHDRKISQWGGQEDLLKPGQIVNPLIVLANYFFDTIEHDAFQVEQGKLFEVRSTLVSKKPLEQKEKVDIADLEDMPSRFEVSAAGYYPDEVLNSVLSQYTDIEEASFLLPTGAFECIRNLLRLSNQRLLLISSDKGVTRKDWLPGINKLTLRITNSIFAYPVNYDAIARYFVALGGNSLSTSDPHLAICTSISYLSSSGNPQMEELAYTFFERFDRTNPPNFLLQMHELLDPLNEDKRKKLEGVIAFVRTCNCDPRSLCLLAPQLMSWLENIDKSTEAALLDAIEKSVANYFCLQQKTDVFYWAGRIYYELNHFQRARELLTESLEEFGPNGYALFYIAACMEMLEEFTGALQNYEHALALDPSCEDTAQAIARLTAVQQE